MHRITPRAPDNVVSPLDYEVVAASDTAEPLGATGRLGDYLKRLIIVPAAANCGDVILLDGDQTIFTWTGGDPVALLDLKPIVVEIDALSKVAGGWKITTGASVSVVAIGDFT